MPARRSVKRFRGADLAVDRRAADHYVSGAGGELRRG
jgi:hypothetical protein